jgi:hypothetical protein
MLVPYLTLAFLLLTGCVSNESKLNSFASPTTNTDKLTFEDNLEILETVTYLAVLTPVNSAIAGNAYGSFTFHKDHDFIVANVRLNESSPIVTQIQKVHTGNACPTEADDLNGDGYIDVVESAEVTGNVIIPLDGDISSQYSLLGSYPISDAWGAYVYSKTASFSEFYKDLFDIDINPEDEVIKLTSPLGLVGKTVLIYGMKENLEIPSTVATNNDLLPHETLPIACGIITLVTDVPGTFEPDDITLGRVPGPRPQPGTTPRPGSNSQPGTNPRPGSTSQPGANPHTGSPHGPHSPGTTDPSNPDLPPSEYPDPWTPVPDSGDECTGDIGKNCSNEY